MEIPDFVALVLMALTFLAASRALRALVRLRGGKGWLGARIDVIPRTPHPVPPV
ncbi:MAG: hypothetical protein ABI868_25580 [Acidobacteriota bacterium]